MVAKKKKKERKRQQRRLVWGMGSKPPPAWLGRKDSMSCQSFWSFAGVFYTSSRGKKDVSHLKGFTTLVMDKEDRRS